MTCWGIPMSSFHLQSRTRGFAAGKAASILLSSPAAQNSTLLIRISTRKAPVLSPGVSLTFLRPSRVTSFSITISATLFRLASTSSFHGVCRPISIPIWLRFPRWRRPRSPALAYHVRSGSGQILRRKLVGTLDSPELHKPSLHARQQQHLRRHAFREPAGNFDSTQIRISLLARVFQIGPQPCY